jgi:hypothetical protein
VPLQDGPNGNPQVAVGYPADGVQADQRRLFLNPIGAGVLGAVFNLNHPAHVVHWHFFQMSAANIVVILLMLVVFALAIVLPFPGAARRHESASRHGSAS